jgi:hypothetical protein
MLHNAAAISNATPALFNPRNCTCTCTEVQSALGTRHKGHLYCGCLQTALPVAVVPGYTFQLLCSCPATHIFNNDAGIAHNEDKRHGKVLI